MDILIDVLYVCSQLQLQAGNFRGTIRNTPPVTSLDSLDVVVLP